MRNGLRWLCFSTAFALLLGAESASPSSQDVAWMVRSSESAEPQVTPSQGRTDDPVDGNEDPEESPRSYLDRSLQLERAYRWNEAAKLYGEALESWPDNEQFRDRLRLCESHIQLRQRYADPSFRGELLSLPADRMDRVYRELLTKIEDHYVDAVSYVSLTQKGLDNLEVALRDPVFLEANLDGSDPEQVRALRTTLRGWRNRVSVRSLYETRVFVRRVTQLARRELQLDATPVLLEFTFGACDALDDYTACLTPDRLDDLYAVIEGEFVGLGVELRQDEQFGLVIVDVIEGGPAAEAAIQPGDRIVRIDDESLVGLDLEAAASRLQGEDGTVVDLLITRSDQSPRSVRIVRRPVEVRSVAQAKLLDADQGIGYIQLIGFQKTSTIEIDRAIRTLLDQGMTRLILDLRGNPGGLLNEAVEIADMFLDDGVIVTTRGRALGQSYIYRSQNRAQFSMPLTVLIDKDSASASEILAGALQDHQRAIILGQRSFGKGSVQSIYSLQSVPAGLKLTTARFYSPKNRAYSRLGVEPDVTFRTVARVPADANEPLKELSPRRMFGDPGSDPTLDQALLFVRRQHLARASQPRR